MILKGIRISVVLMILGVLMILLMRAIGQQTQAYQTIAITSSSTIIDEYGTVTYRDLMTQIEFTIRLNETSIAQIDVQDDPIVFDISTLTLPDTSVTIDSLAHRASTDETLLIVDTNENLWMYHTLTTSYHPLPTEYDVLPYNGWSSDGDRLLIIREIEDYVVEFGIHTLIDASYLPIFIHYQVQDGFQTPALPVVRWSPDDNRLLVTPVYMDRIIEYTLYDANTGERLLDRNERASARGNKQVFWAIP